MLNLSVGGDAEGGFQVSLHDGDKHSTFSAEGIKTEAEAVLAAVKQHGGDLLARLEAMFGHTAEPEPEVVATPSLASTPEHT